MQASTDQQPATEDPGIARLMIVEDEFVVAYDLRDTLEHLGYKVVAVVGTGEEAVAMAGQLRPSVILMDIRLAGDIDGIEAAARIRRDSDIPIVFLSAHSSQDTVARAVVTAPFGYLVKPFRGPELRCAIEVAIRKHAIEKQQARDQLHRIGEEVERRVVARTGELEAANRELEAFSCSVAHDLRTPLRGITGFSELLLQDHAAELGDEGRAYVLRMKRSARRMHLLIEVQGA